MSRAKWSQVENSDVARANELVQLYLEDRISADQDCELAEMMGKGKGVSAAPCVVEQARAGVAEGKPLYQALFGQMQRYGWGVAENEEEAARLFRLSHEQGCAPKGPLAGQGHLLVLQVS